MDTCQHSPVTQWYSGQRIFVTGATGFMGKVLIEKLLRCCPGVSVIYILIRQKHGRDPPERLKDFLNSPVFDEIRSHPDGEATFSKLKCLNGDVTCTNLRLTDDEVRELESNVTTVFHMAANVRFNQLLKDAVTLNIGGTFNVLELVCRFKKLKGFVHTSTSYCHCNEDTLEEKLYPAPHNPRYILDLVKWMDEDLLNTLTPKLLANSPNTYAYTKCLTEQLVAEYESKLSIAICRPSIVAAAWKEPLPGWIDNLNGPTGIMVGAGKGIIRSMYCNPEYIADIVPVDVSVNSLLLAAWQVSCQAIKGKTEVFHVVADHRTALTWGAALEMGRRQFFKNPFSICLWYPGGNIKSNRFEHVVAEFFYHTVPAHVVDFIMRVTFNKPFLVNIQRRIKMGLDVLSYYTTRPWYFSNRKLKRIYDKLSERDKEIFYQDIGQIMSEEYMANYILGARRYCVHEEPETIPRARKILRRLYYLDLITNFILVLLLLWSFYLLVIIVSDDGGDAVAL